MEIEYVHVKTRSQFGKQCVFDDEGPMIDENILPDRQLMDDYIYRSPCHTGIQNTKQLAMHEVQTTSAQTKESGMVHIEGGWPKEMNPKDAEATARFRRRVEKDDIWPIKMKNLIASMERCVLQNNAVNIYENFFDDMVMTDLVLPLDVRVVNVYEDPQTLVRPITHLSWSPDRGKRLAVSYCSREFEREPIDRNPWSYIWEIENPNKPLMALKAFCPSVTVEFNPRDPSMLISGLMSGQVCNWDIRQGDKPAQISHLQFSHRNPANLALWINSKTNTEFFSASTGGAIKWWDLRKLREPTETLVMDLENPSRGDYVRAIGVSSLQYEPTMGTKFMAGMENGMVVSGTRKGKNAQEKLALRFTCHAGPVITIDRNPFSTKNFLTIGGWVTRIWSEDTREGNLISIKRDKTAYTGGCWSTSRYSVFYLIDESGVMKIYDLLVGMKSPVKTIRLCENGLRAITAHEEGNLVAVGSDTGNVYLVESSEALTTNMRNDKSLVTTYLDRCSRYVKAVDNRLKEIRLVQRLSVIEPIEDPISPSKGKSKAFANDFRVKDTNDKKVEEKAGKEEAGEDKERKSKAKVKKTRDSIQPAFGDPELEEAEARYFEMINKEVEKYAEIAALEEATDEAALARLSSPRKDSKRRKHEDSKAVPEKRSDSLKMKGRKSRAGRLTRAESKIEEIVIVRKTKEDRKEEEKEEEKSISPKINEQKDELDRITDEYDDETGVTEENEESKEPTTTRDKTRAKLRKKSKKPKVQDISVEMKKPCADYVCQPDICCIDEIAAEKAREKEAEAIIPVETSAEDSSTQLMIDKMLANLPKVTSPEELGHLLEPIEANEDSVAREKSILSKKDARPSLLDERVKIANREYVEWKAAIRNHDLMKSLKAKRSEEEKNQEAAIREIFEEIVEPHVNQEASQLTEQTKASFEKIPSIDDIDDDEDDEDEDQVTKDQDDYTRIRKKRVKSEKVKIPTDCEPPSEKFGDKEIKRIIGIPDAAPKPPSTPPRLKQSKIKISRTKGVYPRISAAAIPKLEKKDSASSK